jgi:hypothetical protein
MASEDKNMIVISAAEIKKSLTTLSRKELIAPDGTLKAGVRHKMDILMYMVYLWQNNKGGPLQEIGNKTLCKKNITDLIKKFSRIKITEIVAELNKKILESDLKIKHFKSELKVKDYEDMIYFLDHKLEKCRKTLESYSNINIVPNIKFVTGDIPIPESSVSLTFTNPKSKIPIIMEK